MSDVFRFEFEVPVPDGASPEEEDRLIDEAVNRSVGRKIDDDLDGLLGGFGA